jgi:hypothetical protein
MAITYPVNLDALPKPTNATQRNAPGFELGTVVADLATAIERLQAKVGKDGSAVTSSHDWKLGRFTFTGSDVSIAGGLTLSKNGATDTVPLLVQNTGGGPAQLRIANATNSWALRAAGTTIHLWDITAGVSRVQLSGAGLVGVGRSPTSESLEVSGDASLWGTIPKLVLRSPTNVNNWSIRANISDAVNGALQFQNAGASRMEVSNTGVDCWMATTGSLKRLDVGAVDSAGAGFRTVRVPN